MDTGCKVTDEAWQKIEIAETFGLKLLLSFLHLYQCNEDTISKPSTEMNELPEECHFFNCDVTKDILNHLLICCRGNELCKKEFCMTFKKRLKLCKDCTDFERTFDCQCMNIQELGYHKNNCRRLDSKATRIPESDCDKFYCKGARNLVCHLAFCNDSKNCSEKLCSLTNELLRHWICCENPMCIMCLPLKSADRPHTKILSTSGFLARWKKNSSKTLSESIHPKTSMETFYFDEQETEAICKFEIPHSLILNGGREFFLPRFSFDGFEWQVSIQTQLVNGKATIDLGFYRDSTISYRRPSRSLVEIRLKSAKMEQPDFLRKVGYEFCQGIDTSFIYKDFIEPSHLARDYVHRDAKANARDRRNFMKSGNVHFEIWISNASFFECWNSIRNSQLHLKPPQDLFYLCE